MKLSILYNTTAKRGFKSGWGFSRLIDEKILFDTGADSESLLYNMDKLNINPDAISKIVISHRHYDHTGGLSGLLNRIKGNKPIIIWPDNKHSFKVSEGIYSTGALSSGPLGPKEQSLVIESPKGAILVVGCSHPGVDNILKAAKRIGGNIYAIIGGFHDFDKIDELDGIELIGACHCTQHLQEIKKKFPANFKEINAGDVYDL